MRIPAFLQDYLRDRDLVDFAYRIVLNFSTEPCLFFFVGVGDDILPSIDLDPLETLADGLIPTILSRIEKHPIGVDYDDFIACGAFYPENKLDEEKMKFEHTLRGFVTDWTQTVIVEKGSDGSIHYDCVPYPILRKEMIPC